MARGVQQEELADYCEQLAQLLAVDTPLEEALQLLRHGWEHAALTRLAVDLHQRVSAGEGVAAVLAERASLPAFLAEPLAAAEEGAGQAFALTSVADYLRADAAISLSRGGELRATLYYPGMVMAVVLLITAVLLIFVIPQFEAMFSSFGADLPAVTELVIGISHILLSGWWWLLPLLLLVILGWRHLLGRSSAFQHFNIRLLSRLPGYGALYLQSRAARLLLAWAFQVQHGATLNEALKGSGQLPLGPAYGAMLDGLVKGEAQGRALPTAMEAETMLPSRVSQAVMLATRVEQPSALLRSLADSYTQRLHKRIKPLAKQQEVVLIVLMGLVIGTLVVAMYLPIFMLGQVV